MEGEIIMKKQVKNILTRDELIQVYEHRISLLKSESAMERNYYNYEINKIIEEAEERYNAELKNPVRIRDVMTTKELQEFEDLNLAVLTSITKSQREYYNNEIEQIIEEAKKRYFTESKKPIRVKDVMTSDELAEVHRLNIEIMRSSTKMEIRYYKHEINRMIEKAKRRYGVSVGSSYDFWLEDDDLYDDLVDEEK